MFLVIKIYTVSACKTESMHGALCFAAEEMQRGKGGPHNLRDRYIEFKKTNNKDSEMGDVYCPPPSPTILSPSPLLRHSLLHPVMFRQSNPEAKLG